jgi:two-component system, cell cycle response regulator
MNTDLHIALCGLSARDERMVQIVLTRATGVASNRRCVIVDPASAIRIGLVIVDMQSPFSLEELQQLRSRHPGVLPIFISDDGVAGTGKFKLSRRSLLVELLRVVDAAALAVADPVANRQRIAQSVMDGVVTRKREPSALIEGENSEQASNQVKKFLPLTALVVDDSAAVRAQMESALQRVGVSCVLAQDAAQALAQTGHRPFDLIFLDVVMPGKDGYQLCREIRQNPYTRSTPVLMLTSRSSPFDRARGALAGCTSYLIKPIDSKTFYQTVDKVLLKAFNEDRRHMHDRGYRPAVARA